MAGGAGRGKDASAGGNPPPRSKGCAPRRPPTRRGKRLAPPAPPHAAGLLPLEAPPAAASAALDVIFPVLHGTFGEDGTVQGLLELANISYLGGRPPPRPARRWM